MKHLFTQHLVKSSLCILLLHVFTSSYVHGQTWSLYGNSISGYERLGTRNAKPLNLSTYGQIRMSITSQGQVGIGTALSQCSPINQLLSAIGTKRKRSGGLPFQLQQWILRIHRPQRRWARRSRRWRRRSQCFYGFFCDKPI